jgi:hypothetical protein
LCCIGATPLLGQVIGHPPSQSPYTDIESPQRIWLFGGYFKGGKDVAGAAPQSAPLFGAQYEVTVGGPAQFFVRVQRVSSQRATYNPAAPTAKRDTVGDPLWLTDLGFSFNLTGQKSWHRIVPTIAFGIGIAGLKQAKSTDPYDFGTQFQISTDFNINYMLTNSSELRLGVGNTLYQNHYPNAYYVANGSTPALLGTNVPKSSYLSNWRFTAGLAVPIFR